MRHELQIIYWERFMTYQVGELFLAEHILSDCLHAPDLESTGNPYHLEGNVLTHVALAYWSIRDFDSREDQLVGLAVLCHDIGKPLMRKISDKGRASFIGHGYASAMYTPKLLKHLDPDITIREMELIISAVSAHIEVYSFKQPVPLFAEDPDVIRISMKLGRADEAGSVTRNTDTIETVTFAEPMIYRFATRTPFCQEIFITVGVPGSGKSTWAQSMDLPVFGYDNYLVNLAAERGLGDAPYSDIFDIAIAEKWVWQEKCLIDAEDHVKHGRGSIIIDGTHMGHKRRMGLYNRFQKYGNIINVMFWRDIDACIAARNESSGKYIPVSVMMDMATKFMFPRNGAMNGVRHVINPN
jgi:predicted kinase